MAGREEKEGVALVAWGISLEQLLKLKNFRKGNLSFKSMRRKSYRIVDIGIKNLIDEVKTE